MLVDKRIIDHTSSLDQTHQNQTGEAERTPPTELSVEELHARLTEAFGEDVTVTPAKPKKQKQQPEHEQRESDGHSGWGADPSREERSDSPKLDYGTHSVPNILKLFDTYEPTGPCYRVVTHDFGNGVIETVVVKQEEKMPRPKKGRKRKSKTRDEMDPEILERSVNRAKKNMRHKLLMMKADRMLTLTFKENLEDLGEAYKCLAKFERYCRKSFGDFPFVAVHEKQKRGAIHFHLAIDRFYCAQVVRYYWKKAVGDYGGNINIKKTGKGEVTNRVKIAKYMSKYMSKDMDQQEINKKRYSSSRGIPEPKKTTLFLSVGPNTFRFIYQYIREYSGKSVRTEYRIPDTIRPIWYFATY